MKTERATCGTIRTEIGQIDAAIRRFTSALAIAEIRKDERSINILLNKIKTARRNRIGLEWDLAEAVERELDERAQWCEEHVLSAAAC